MTVEHDAFLTLYGPDRSCGITPGSLVGMPQMSGTLRPLCHTSLVNEQTRPWYTLRFPKVFWAKEVLISLQKEALRALATQRTSCLICCCLDGPFELITSTSNQHSQCYRSFTKHIPLRLSRHRAPLSYTRESSPTARLVRIAS